MLPKTSRVISSKARQPLGRRPKGKAIPQCAPNFIAAYDKEIAERFFRKSLKVF